MSFTKLLNSLFALLLVGLLAVYLSKHTEPRHTAQTAVLPAPAAPVVTLDEYGLNVTHLDVIEKRIERNQTFSEILAPHGVSGEAIHKIVDAASPVFDIRGLQAGKPYRLYMDQSGVRFLIYQQSDIEYVVFDLASNPRVHLGQRPVTVEQQTVSGTIDGSLYGALSEFGADPQLAAKLAEVYAWQIDFYRIQKGDAFKVVYEQQEIDGKPIGVGNILAADFTHFDRTYYAFRFEQNGVVDYYDEEGESLRKAFLKSPLKFSRMTSGFTMRRFHPVQKRWKAHLGTDYAAPTGTPIMSTGDGVVLEARSSRGNGNYVKVRHNGTYTTGYLHMSRIGKDIRPGTRVTQGQVIGYVGSTGLATGPHVCYRFWKNGTQVDHLDEEFPSANPVLDQNRLAFETVRDGFISNMSPFGIGRGPAYASVEQSQDEQAL